MANDIQKRLQSCLKLLHLFP